MVRFAFTNKPEIEKLKKEEIYFTNLDKILTQFHQLAFHLGFRFQIL